MKISEKHLPSKLNFMTFFCHVIALILGQNSVKGLRVTKNVKTIKFERLSVELESKKKFPATKTRKISETNSTLQILDFYYEKKNTQNEHIIANFEYFFTCHYSKTVWLAENVNEIKITHFEKIFSHIK